MKKIEDDPRDKKEKAERNVPKKDEEILKKGGRITGEIF